MKSKVYFSSVIAPETVVRLYHVLGYNLPGRVAVKLHSGETGNQNFLPPEFWKPAVDAVSGTMVECNTAYEGTRNTTAAHWETMKSHGWSNAMAVDIMDEDGETELPIPEGKIIKTDYVGSHISRYDSVLVLSHFKGHPMGGFGGALKNISIGIASSHGKAYIHGAGKPEDIWTADHDSFLGAMADAACAVKHHFGDKMLFINAMVNMSVDCDCCEVAEDPCMADIGILASRDPVALDRACLDLVYGATSDPGREHLLERIESLNGAHTVDCAAKLGVGTTEYELIKLD